MQPCHTAHHATNGVTVGRLLDSRPMRDGTRRADVPYLWPRTLQAPRRPPRLVYLDLNHWIALAKAQSAHPDGEKHRETLEWCCDAVDQGVALFPISDTIYMEISKIGQHRRRRDLLTVIERVSRFFVITSRDVIATHEVEALLDELVGPSPRPINSMNYLDWGLARAFGMVGGFRARSPDGDDVTADVRASHPHGPDAFDAILAEATMNLNRRAIEGPSPDEETEMRTLGWDPSALFEVSERRAKQEIEQVTRFDDDPTWRRGRIRDVVAAREVLIELNDTLNRGLAERSTDFADIFPEPETTRRLDSLPSFDVSVTLKTSYHRDPSHRWTTNDVHDIDALASTVPYCDVVVTDKAACSHVTRTGLAQRLETVVLSDLARLPAALS